MDWFVVWLCVLNISLVITCLLGDHLCFSVLEGKSRIEIKAVCDSIVHGAVAFLSWLIVVLDRQVPISDNLKEALICGLFASAIDLDHFIEARSFRINDAIKLTRRPFLHNSSLPIISWTSVILVTRALKGPLISSELAWKITKYSTMIFIVAILSHHVRDASRRGLWMPPISNAIPVSYISYVILTVILPLTVRVALNYCDDTTALKQPCNMVEPEEIELKPSETV